MDYAFLAQYRRLKQEYKNIIEHGSRQEVAKARLQLKLLDKKYKEACVAQSVRQTGLFY